MPSGYHVPRPTWWTVGPAWVPGTPYSRPPDRPSTPGQYQDETPVGPPAPATDWARAIAFGVPVALASGAAWGAIAAASGFVFGIVALVIGLAVSAAVGKGAGNISGGVYALAAGLTIAAIFFGQIVTITIVIAEFGGTFVDAILLYPAVVAELPYEFALQYVFGLIGIGAGAGYLSRLSTKQRTAAAPPMIVPYPAGTTPMPVAGATPVAPTVPNSAGGVSVRILHRGSLRAAADVFIPGLPPRTVHVEYETFLGKATILLDGYVVFKTRIWRMEKRVRVPLGDVAQRDIEVRFAGFSPRIDVALNGIVVAQV